MTQQLLEKSPLSFNASQGQIPKGEIVIVLEGREASPGKVVNTERGQSYKIINAATNEVVKPLKVERVGKKLKVTLADGEILELMNFFDDGQAQLAEFLLSTRDSACPIVIIESALASSQDPVLDAHGNELLWSADVSSAQMCLYAPSAAFTPAALPIVAAAAGLGPVGVVAAGVLGLAAAGGGGPATTPPPTAPGAFTLSDNVGAVQGALSVGASSDDTTPTLSGTGGTPGQTITVYDGTTLLGTTTVNADGSWSFTPTALTQGGHALRVTTKDGAGPESAFSPVFTLTVDTTAPAAPVTPTLTDNQGSVTGPIGGGGSTDDRTPTFTGTGTPGDTITLTDGSNPGTVIGTTTVGPNCCFILKTEPL